MHIVALRVFGIAFPTLRVVACAMAMSAAEAEEFFDQMLSQTNDFEFAARNYPVLNPTVIDEQNLQRDHWRFLQPLPPKKKKVWSFFDVVDSWQPPSDTWDASSLDDVAVAVKKHGNAKLADFPYGLPPKLALPNGALMSVVVCEPDGEGRRTVIKRIALAHPITGAQAAAYCIGDCCQTPWRQDTFGARKMTRVMMERTRGWRMLYDAVNAKDSNPAPAAPHAPRRGNSSALWDPSQEEIDAGIAWINSKAKPLGNSKNEQFAWILKQIRDPESPIYGWPESKVEKACNNLAKAKSSCDTEEFFPLNVMDLHPVWVLTILPLIVPYFASFGLLIAGCAGVGKTQLGKILSMALGRWRVSTGGLSEVPGFRRGAQIDVFREQPGRVAEGILVDDPQPLLDCWCIELLKALLDIGESVLCNARYSPAKFVRNQFRAIFTNTWDPEAEHKEGFIARHTACAHEQFMKMLQPVFAYSPEPHVMAVLKRTVTIIAGKHAVYVRLPSEKADQTIHVFGQDAVAEDWLSPTNKAFLKAYRKGSNQFYEGFDEKVAEEQALIAQWMSESESVPVPAADDEDAQAAERWRQDWELTPLENAQKKIRDLEDELAALRLANMELEADLAMERGLPKRRCAGRTAPASQQEDEDPMGHGFGL